MIHIQKNFSLLCDEGEIEKIKEKTCFEELWIPDEFGF
jgi:hypothetical protein